MSVKLAKYSVVLITHIESGTDILYFQNDIPNNQNMVANAKIIINCFLLYFQTLW